MQIPVILHANSTVSGQKPGATPAAGDAPGGGAFNQMLSRQMAEHRSAGNAGQARMAASASDAGKAREKNISGKPAAMDEASRSRNIGTKSPDNTPPGTDAVATKDTEGKPVTDANPAALSATELLAMVADSLALSTAPGVTGNAALEAAGTAPPAIAAAGSARLLAAIGHDQAAQPKQAGADTGQADFAAALELAGGQQQAAERITELTVQVPGQALTEVSGMVPQIQQGGLDMAQAAAGKPVERLAPPVGTPAWDQAIGQKVVWMVAGAQQSASLTLNPPDLGPLQVVLHVSNGQADASFFAAQPEVRQALEAALPRLREMMHDAGVELGQATVSAGMADQHQAGEPAPERSARNPGHADAQNETEPQVARLLPAIGRQGMVDTFA